MDDFAKLSPENQRDAFMASAATRGVLPVIIEKDFWVCWSLRRLFEIKDQIGTRMVFKGGTSLSKVWNLIDRFSEDIDISLHQEDLGYKPEPGQSKKKENKAIEHLDHQCQARVQGVVLPALLKTYRATLGHSNFQLMVDPQDSQSLVFRYPSSLPNQSGYLAQQVKLEFGARSEHWPTEDQTIRPYVAIDLPQVAVSAEVPVKVVKAERTFLDKVLILYTFHHWPPEKPLNDRQSRHYYDVYRLFPTEVGERAVNDRELFEKVVDHQIKFFFRSWAKYDLAKRGAIRLAPSSNLLPLLEKDYEAMTEMIFGEIPSFQSILDCLRELEQAMN